MYGEKMPSNTNVICLYFIINILYNPTWVSYGNTIIRNRTSDNASGSDNTVLPIVTPGKTMLPPPIHAPSQIFIGNAYVLQIPVFISSSFIILSCTFVEWVAVYSCTLEAISTLLPISMILLSTNVQFMLMTT